MLEWKWLREAWIEVKQERDHRELHERLEKYDREAREKRAKLKRKQY